MKTYGAAVVVAAVVGTLAAGPAALAVPAAPKGMVGAVETYRSYNGHECLASSGAGPLVARCADGAVAQQWTPHAAGPHRTLVNVATGKCLVTESGRRVLLGDCELFGEAAAWQVLCPVQDGVQFKSAATGLCLDNYRGQLIMSPCAQDLFVYQTWR
ncbi:MAG TPA: RICIN domain-containing protein [Pilimelia sp.]|nr:RICIN domain-containing protein [Pilimelia sp.]